MRDVDQLLSRGAFDRHAVLLPIGAAQPLRLARRTLRDSGLT
jgi:hypothetical protein